MFRTIFTRRCAEQVARTNRAVEQRRRQLAFARNDLKTEMRSPAVGILLVGSVSLVWWLSRRDKTPRKMQVLDAKPTPNDDLHTDTEAVMVTPGRRSAVSRVARLASLLLAVTKIFLSLRATVASPVDGAVQAPPHPPTSMQ